MKALVYDEPGRIAVRDVPEPSLRPSDLLLRPLYVGLCFSERHAYETQDWFPIRGGTVLGHEGCAEVVQIGSDVEDFEVGDRVAVNPVVGCGRCLGCSSGYALHCSAPPGPELGMLSELCVSHRDGCFSAPPTVSDVALANVEPLAVGTRAARLSGLAVGDHVVVFGLDDYSLGAMQWARIGGASKVVVVDPIALRRDVARDLGATAVVDPTDGDATGALRSMLPTGADLCFVSVENYIPAAQGYLKQAFSIARMQATVMVTRVYGRGGWPPFPTWTPWTKEITVKHAGAFFGDEPERGGRIRGDYQLTIDALSDGRLDGERFVTRVVTFDEISTSDDVCKLFERLPNDEFKLLVQMS